LTPLLYSLLSPPFLPPPSTLFPYTTLFRSLVAQVLAGSGLLAFPAYKLDRRAAPSKLGAGLFTFALAAGNGVAGLDLSYRECKRSEEQRLNSSHVSISYAVFCLKKKNSLWT